MKIGFDANVLDGRYQGSRTVLSHLSRALAERHRDLEVLLFSQSRPEYCDGTAGAPVHHPIASQSSFTRLGVTLPASVRDCDLDAIIYQYIFAPWSKHSWVVIHDILPITHPHLFSHGFRIRSLVLFSLSILFSKNIVAVSNYTANAIKTSFPSYRGTVHVVPNGPSFPSETYFSGTLPRPDRNDLPTSGRYILAVGRLEKRKNIQLLIRAFTAAELNNVQLVIVGNPETENDKPPTSNSIVWIQDADDTLLAYLHQNADLFVYPSEAEGFGIPLLDSVLFGTPTLSSNRTAMIEVGGTLAEYFDPAAVDAAEILEARLKGHFSSLPVKTPSLEERTAHAASFSWARSADILASALRGAQR